MPAPKGHPPYNKNGEGGRPLKYDDNYLNELADKLELWIKDDEHIWYEDFLLENDLLPHHLTLFAERSERFQQAYHKAKVWQRGVLVKGGLSTTFNANITKFVLANTSGWSEKNETKVSGSQNDPMVHLIVSADNCTKDLVNESNSRSD